MPRLRLALAQLNPVLGDVAGNSDQVTAAYAQAVDAGADLVVFPELVVTGYPPEDLLLRGAFVTAAAEAVEKLAARTSATVAVVGFPEPGEPLANAAAVCAGGRVLGVYRKHLLPNYAVFDEQRYFRPGTDAGPLFDVAGLRVGVSICEDIWSADGPPTQQAAMGAQLVVNINASPYYEGRLAEREQLLHERSTQLGIPIAYVNLVGGQDELVFDGGSMVADSAGRVAARARQFVPDLLMADLDLPSGTVSGRVEEVLDPDAEVY